MGHPARQGLRRELMRDPLFLSDFLRPIGSLVLTHGYGSGFLRGGGVPNLSRRLLLLPVLNRSLLALIAGSVLRKGISHPDC